ncbi:MULTISPECIES: 3-dehydro-L-gulonate 2-dehydrogenase [unclassified Chitinophaga]|uniref:3-dehydro-L-gulonate 2-dehydrogenase n=1 Tax=unclassified Chitinophaga TaxID=2619133 RepID=UPI0009D3C6FF|nr:MULTISPECIES: 3-dehydro-L-gulonate 2-dehydrogenase [unclassified Chitinophaga]OMP78922.1 3-dehydro-L-gulonate 2-dehydrogenase [[Flexibacter] sp. ATCC 35208]WPV64393.1 3-dehydro-L-gulonate 2-dehydrogenase [Chitinophaga sp. LS1]
MRVKYEELKQVFIEKLIDLGFDTAKAGIVAGIFADNSRDGVYSHGLNRFPVFAQLIKDGLVDPNATPEMVEKHGLIETWEGYNGAGMFNATVCMDRGIELAKQYGVGIVGIRNTNHWMRGGTYGWQAAQADCIGICFTNAMGSMPPWGGTVPRLGNNPLVIAVPRPEHPIVLDMAMSQYSYGKMQEYELKQKELPFEGGYDSNGALTKDPAEIRKTKRALPIGLWKGSGLALMLDVLLGALTGGRSVEQITASGKEFGVSQCFIAIHKPDFHESLIAGILEYTKSENPDQISFPGENTYKTRMENLLEGIPVNEEMWKQVKSI